MVTFKGPPRAAPFTEWVTWIIRNVFFLENHLGILDLSQWHSEFDPLSATLKRYVVDSSVEIRMYDAVVRIWTCQIRRKQAWQ